MRHLAFYNHEYNVRLTSSVPNLQPDMLCKCVIWHNCSLIQSHKISLRVMEYTFQLRIQIST